MEAQELLAHQSAHWGFPSADLLGPKQGHAGVHLHVPNCSFSSCMTDPRQLAILQFGPGWQGPINWNGASSSRSSAALVARSRMS